MSHASSGLSKKVARQRLQRSKEKSRYEQAVNRSTENDTDSMSATRLFDESAIIVNECQTKDLFQVFDLPDGNSIIRVDDIKRNGS